jgi:hypothetical protein
MGLALSGMTERDRAAGRLLLERGLTSSDALRRCAQTTQERRQRGEQIEVLQVLVEQGALDRNVASSLWRELQASGPAPRPAPSSDSARLAPPGAQAPGAWSPGAPTLRGDFSSPDATPTLGPGAIAQNMPGFPGGPPPGPGTGSFNGPPLGGFGPPPVGPPPMGPPGTAGFGPPPGYGSGSFNAPPPQPGFGNGSFNSPGGQPGFGPPPGYGSGSFNAPPPQPGFGPPPGYGSGSFNAPPQPGFGPPPGFGHPPPPQGFNGGPGFGPAPGYPQQLPPGGAGYDPTAMTIRSPVGGLDAPPVAETVRSPEGLAGDAEDLASTVKAPSGRVGGVDFQSDFDPLGSGFGNGPPPSVAIAPQSQAGFPVDPGPSAPPEPQAPPEPATGPMAPKKSRTAGASSRRKKASGRERPVSGRVRAARAKREKTTSPAVYIGGGIGLLILLIVIVVAVASSGPDPEPAPSPDATPTSEDTPADTPREDPPVRPSAEPSRAPVASSEGPIPAKYLKEGSSAEAPVRAEDLEGDLIAVGDHLVEQAEYQKAVTLARKALKEWPGWLKGTPAHDRYRLELERREKQLRFSKHLDSLVGKPRSAEAAKMIGAIAGQHLHADLEDLPCVEKFKGEMMEVLGEDEYDAIFVQEFDPKELQDDFKDDE